MERTGVIYGICHIATDRWYIGQTVRSLRTRLAEHWQASSYSSLHLYNAIRKYGRESFKIEVLEENVPESKLDERECYYINKYESLEKGFNNTGGGGGVRGYHHTAESRLKISAGVKKTSHLWNNLDRALRIKNAQKGRQFTLAHRQHISESRKGKFTGTDNPFFHKHHSNETKAIIGEANHKWSVSRHTKEGVFIATYITLQDATKAVVEEGLSTAKFSSIYDRIKFACLGSAGTKSAYGYVWKYIEKCND